MPGDDKTSRSARDVEQPGNSSDPKRGNFKRGYVACTPCRARKVRCVLESGPPCAKCRREHRECLFETHRKSLRHREPPRWTRTTDPPLVNQMQQSQSPADVTHTQESPASPTLQLANHHVAGSVLRPLGPQQPNSLMSDQRIDESPASTNPSLSERVLSVVMTRPGDALDVLFDAAQPQTPQLHSITNLGNHIAQQHDPVPTWPRVTSSPPHFQGSAITQLSVPSSETLDLWDKSRFVRQGLITAQEAVTYLDLFFEHIAPLSPVLPNSYRQHSSHYSLIHEEAMLCCTVLMISSRFFTLPGAGGVSRSHHIHQRLWQYCEHLIRRIMFGQEKLSTAKTRVVGTIESFILISDWHPRAIHFPPETEGWDSLLVQPGYDRTNRLVIEGDVPLIRWREDVFEPAKRAERMSWMLLGAATNLAYELGIFSEEVETALPGNFPTSRYLRAKQLLFIYVSQQAVRLGCSSILPQSITMTSATASLELNSDAQDKSWTSFMCLWMDLTQLTKTASAMFFQSKAHARQQLLNGHYIILLQHFDPSLSTWYDKFIASSSDLSEPFKDLLFIEYKHLRIYTSALSIQAVVERAVTRGVSTTDKSQADVFKACVHLQDWKFISDVISDSCKILQKATSMAQAGRLRYTPMRTLIYITTASVLLLKSISLGARNTDIPTALSILEGCIAALRVSAIDDMDFSPRYATLMEKHVSRFRASYTVPQSPNRSDGTAHASDTAPMVGSDRKDLSENQPAEQSRIDTSARDILGQEFDLFDPFQFPGGESDWAARPFDPSVAPFGASCDHISLGFELDSLDFLWNLPDPL